MAMGKLRDTRLKVRGDWQDKVAKVRLRLVRLGLTTVIST